MAERQISRRLAAILCADVAGYSRLMGVDEDGTLAALRSHRQELIDPSIAAHQGRIVGTAGDSVLVEFQSVVASVECALEVQNGVRQRNAGIPREQQMLFRVGVNLGEVIEEEGDIFGEGVNIAARLQDLAEPGGIVVSAGIRREAMRSVDLITTDLGLQAVKNIKEPVRAFRVLLEGDTAGPISVSSTTRSSQPSIAVLPFDNMSGDPEQEYFVDGITEDVITGLSSLRHLAVIARNSTFVYKNRAVDVVQVADELGVRYVVEGSVRKAGHRVRITVQLIDASTGQHAWAERFDRELEDIFDLQDEITDAVVAAVDPVVRTSEIKRAIRKPPGSLDAWDHLQRGLWQSHRFDPTANAVAREHLLQAIQLDPGFALAHAWLAMTHFHDAWLGWTDSPDHSLAQAHDAAKHAVALDNREAMAYAALGVTAWRMGRLDTAEWCGRRAMELSPSLPFAYLCFAAGSMYGGRHRATVDALEKLVRLAPNDPWIWAAFDLLAASHFFLGEYESAVAAGRRSVELRHGAWYARVFVLAALGAQDESAEAARESADLLRVAPGMNLDRLAVFPFRPDDLAELTGCLRQAGVGWVEEGDSAG